MAIYLDMINRKILIEFFLIITIFFLLFSYTSCGNPIMQELLKSLDIDKENEQSSVPGNSLREKLDWIYSNTRSNTIYLVTIDQNEWLDPYYIDYGNSYYNITVQLSGNGGERIVMLSSNGSLFSIYNGTKLVLDNRVTLKGRSYNSSSLINISNGTLVMNNGSKITGNTASEKGGGVYIGSNSTFIMNGGVIMNNTSGSTAYSSTGFGGGVFINSNCAFDMSGGVISGNTVRIKGFANNTTGGGGVYVCLGSFAKSGDSIIYGYSGPNDTNWNKVEDVTGAIYFRGHAVYCNISTGALYRDSTAGTNADLNSNEPSSSLWSYP